MKKIFVFSFLFILSNFLKPQTNFANLVITIDLEQTQRFYPNYDGATYLSLVNALNEQASLILTSDSVWDTFVRSREKIKKEIIEGPEWDLYTISIPDIYAQFMLIIPPKYKTIIGKENVNEVKLGLNIKNFKKIKTKDPLPYFYKKPKKKLSRKQIQKIRPKRSAITPEKFKKLLEFIFTTYNPKDEKRYHELPIWNIYMSGHGWSFTQKKFIQDFETLEKELKNALNHIQKVRAIPEYEKRNKEIQRGYENLNAIYEKFDTFYDTISATESNIAQLSFNQYKIFLNFLNNRIKTNYLFIRSCFLASQPTLVYQKYAAPEIFNFNLILSGVFDRPATLTEEEFELFFENLNRVSKTKSDKKPLSIQKILEFVWNPDDIKSFLFRSNLMPLIRFKNTPQFAQVNLKSVALNTASINRINTSIALGENKSFSFESDKNLILLYTPYIPVAIDLEKSNKERFFVSMLPLVSHIYIKSCNPHASLPTFLRYFLVPAIEKNITQSYQAYVSDIVTVTYPNMKGEIKGLERNKEIQLNTVAIFNQYPHLPKELSKGDLATGIIFSYNGTYYQRLDFHKELTRKEYTQKYGFTYYYENITELTKKQIEAFKKWYQETKNTIEKKSDLYDVKPIMKVIEKKKSSRGKN